MPSQSPLIGSVIQTNERTGESTRCENVAIPSDRVSYSNMKDLGTKIVWKKSQSPLIGSVIQTNMIQIGGNLPRKSQSPLIGSVIQTRHFMELLAVVNYVAIPSDRVSYSNHEKGI